MRLAIFAAAGLLLISQISRAGDLLVRLPRDVHATSTTASAAGSESAVTGTIQGNTARFTDLRGGLSYDLKIELADGTVLQGIDMRWHDSDPPKANAGDLNNDDRSQIQGILNVPSFFNRSEIAAIRGDHDRAVVLNQLIRDQTFYGDKNGEIIWRIELGYFKNEHGGWAKLPQVPRIIRRERFASKADFQKVAAKLKWTPPLGGISVRADGVTTLVISSLDEPANTRPSSDDEGG